MSFLEKNRENISKLLHSLLKGVEKSARLELGLVHFNMACEMIVIHIKTDECDITRVLYRGILEKALLNEDHVARTQINRVLREAIRISK